MAGSRPASRFSCWAPPAAWAPTQCRSPLRSAATVTGVCSAAKAEFVRSLGAAHVLDYRTDDVLDGLARYDLILDIAGDTPLRTLRRSLLPTGSLVIVGGEGKGYLTGGFGRSLRAPLTSMLVR